MAASSLSEPPFAGVGVAFAAGAEAAPLTGLAASPTYNASHVPVLGRSEFAAKSHKIMELHW